jgi:hypothetical protein
MAQLGKASRAAQRFVNDVASDTRLSELSSELALQLRRFAELTLEILRRSQIRIRLLIDNGGTVQSEP